MSSWFETPLGRELLSTESALLEQCLPRRFGYHLLQLGCANLNMHGASPIGHKFSMSPEAGGAGHGAIAKGEALPLGGESVDLALLHHALDYSADQHQLLREAFRVLIAGGHIVIVGFNFFSSWGLRHWLSKHKAHPWQARPLRAARVADWLKLLDFKVEQILYGACCLPLNSSRAIRYSSALSGWIARSNWPVGGVYLIAAKKQVAPLTPVRQAGGAFQAPAWAFPWWKMRLGLPIEVAGLTRPRIFQNSAQACENKASFEFRVGNCPMLG